MTTIEDIETVRAAIGRPAGEMADDAVWYGEALEALDRLAGGRSSFLDEIERLTARLGELERENRAAEKP